jgi:hypothetical protein
MRYPVLFQNKNLSLKSEGNMAEIEELLVLWADNLFSDILAGENGIKTVYDLH